MGLRGARRPFGKPRNETAPQLRALAAAVLGEAPLRIVDVGALWGLQPELAPIAQWVEAVGFDPDAGECAELEAQARAAGVSQRFLPFAVAGADCRRTFHVLRKAASSSLLEPEAAFHARFPDAERMDLARTIQVNTRALGSLLDELGVLPELLKLDAHGVEGEILESLSPAQWEPLLGVHVELLLAPQYRGQCSVASVHDALVEHGFELYALKRYAARREGFDTFTYDTRGQLTTADALYLRNASTLEPEARPRLAVIAAAFGHHDAACAIAHDAGDETAAALIDRLARRPPRLVRAIASRLIRLGELGWRMYGGPAGSWTSDRTPDRL